MFSYLQKKINRLYLYSFLEYEKTKRDDAAKDL